MYQRIFLIVLDSVGAGHAPDAKIYGDEGANTLLHIDENATLTLPHLESLGLGCLDSYRQIDCAKHTQGIATRLQEISVGKDTLTGHYEMMGLKVEEPFKTFTETGFPKELINELELKTGHKFIGNYSASGTEILLELGREHAETGALILYTSADSVLQIAANEDIVPLEELYRVCKIAREITLKNEWKVARIIARPYVGTYPEYKRTPHRHDYALKPFAPTVMNTLKDHHLDVIAVGKINDIFDGEGVTDAIPTKSNEDGMDKTIELLERDFKGLVFTNLVDFDSLYGHRRDVKGYANALNVFDKQLGVFLNNMRDTDLLMIVADHGNDPTWTGSDHTREQVPCLLFNKNLPKATMSPQIAFSSLGATICDNFDLPLPQYGQPLLKGFK